MKTPFQLHKRPAEPASALLLLTTDAGVLMRLCARIGGASLPAVHAVAGGFLVRLPRPDRASDSEKQEVFPGVIRLRALSPGLFVPVDAALTPALLEDEANALVRQRGLVFLPGGVVLEFSPAVTLSPAELLAAPRLPDRAWRPLPSRRERPAQLHEILLDIPDAPPDVIIESGGGGIGVETPRPPEASPGKTLAGNAAAKVGKSLIWLGDKLGMQGLAGLGASLVAGAMKAVPRISEAVLGQQEAALRELLRQFREGNIEDALRRALPLGAAGRGGTAAQDAKLPTHSLFYRLGELLGTGQGPGSVWLAASTVYEDLEAAYRRAAEEATRRGDFRRAAFIYGKLLQDWRAAAGVLSRGGLHHDAAILYLEKLSDRHAAAKSFEAAGEVDRALHLYRLHGEYVLAGDLLMRAGEAERAVEEYTLAADKEAAAGRYLAAGELMLTSARRSDLAERYLAAGWGCRPLGDAPGCLLRLTDLYAQKAFPASLLQLLAEADEYFAAPGNDPLAGDFYNRLATLADRENLAAIRDDLRDRALMGLAGKLRQRGADGAHSGTVSRLFGAAGVWEPALVRDAFAAVSGLPRPKQVPRSERVLVKTHRGLVSAACAAQESGDVFLGFEDGVLAHFNPRRGSVTTWQHPGEVAALAVDRRAHALVVVRQQAANVFEATSYQALGTSYTVHNCWRFKAGAPPHLTGVAFGNAGGVVGVWDGRDLMFVSVPDLVTTDRLVCPTAASVLLLDGWTQDRLRDSTVVFEDEPEYYFLNWPASSPENGARRPKQHLSLPLPSFAAASLRKGGAPLFSWLARRRTYLELAFPDAEGGLHWLCVRAQSDDPAVLAHHQTGGQRYLCAALLGPGRVAGVHRDGVAWLGCGERGFVFRPHTQVDLAESVVCYASPLTKELLVVAGGGDVVRVPTPE